MVTANPSGFRPQINTTPYSVMVQTVHNRISGTLHARENERIKDALNAKDTFLALTNVRIFDMNGEQLLHTVDFLAINTANIIWVIEDYSQNR